MTVINAPPDSAITALATLVAAESLRVRRVSPLDGYLETDWYDLQSRRSFGGSARIPHPATTVKLRCWADPYVPGQAVLTIEAAYRPRVDPSRTERDLEFPVADSSDGERLALRLASRLQKRFAPPPPARTP